MTTILAPSPLSPVDPAVQAAAVSVDDARQRGPFRPGQLVPTRSRRTVQDLSRLFRIADVLINALVTAIVIVVLGASSTAAAVMVVGALSLVAAMHALEAYGFANREPFGRQALRLIACLGAAALAALLATKALNQPVASPPLQIWFAAISVTLFALHATWWRIVRNGRRKGSLTPNVVVVGATQNAERFIASALDGGDVNVLGIFDDRAARAPSQIQGVPVLGDTQSLIDHRIMPYVDRVVITVASSAQGRVDQLLERLSVLPNPVSLFLDSEREADRTAALSRIVDLSGLAPDSRRATAKRVQDLVIASLGLLAAAPVMAIVAVAIKLDSPGPVFFRQRRHGFNNEQILVWKFRSMRHEAADAKAARQVSLNDDRVTKVGAFIRKTSLDELPQLFNVLRGEMSMVGPRPHAVGMKTGDVESAQLVACYAHRHRMKPGVTGWAAINGSRGPVDTPELVQQRVALDVAYIERQTFWLDLYIIAMTIPCLLGDRSAVR
jgi:Undecaprenyl-phosphate glucose phosphotransferase